MNNSTFYLIAVFLLACGGEEPSIAPGGKGKDTRPNFLFILIDDLGWMDTGYQGSWLYETPNIDRLATQAVRFTNAYAASPYCSPRCCKKLEGKRWRVRQVRPNGAFAGPSRIGHTVRSCNASTVADDVLSSEPTAIFTGFSCNI